jgi:hypothetical protein
MLPSQLLLLAARCMVSLGHGAALCDTCVLCAGLLRTLRTVRTHVLCVGRTRMHARVHVCVPCRCS